MTLCQHIIKGASEKCSFAALMLSSPLGHLVKIPDRKKKKKVIGIACCLSQRFCTLSKGHNEYNVLTFVIGSESAENI